MFEEFFACRIVVVPNRQYHGNIQRLFRPQNCLSSKSPKTRENSKTFQPAELSQPQIINIPKILKDLLGCRFVLAPCHRNPENVRRFFRLQNCLSPKSLISRKYSKTFSPAELSQQQITKNPEKFEDFFACKIVLAANHQYPGSVQRLFRLQNCLSANYQYPVIIQKGFRLQNCRISKSSISRNFPKTFLAYRIVLAANHQYPGNIQRLFRLQICFSCKSSVSRIFSKNFSPAELSQPQIINITEIFKDFSACRTVLAANHRFSEIFKDFFACIIVLAANHQNPETIQRLFSLQNCLSRKSSTSRKYSKTYWAADLSQPHVIEIPKMFEDFFACRIVLVPNRQYHGNIQRLFRPQNCLSSKSPKTRENSKTFSPAKLSQLQIISIPEVFKDFFACRIVLAQIISIR